MNNTLLARPKERRAFQPFGAARTAWRSRRREVLLSGPAGTGKSRLWLEKLHYCADKYPHMRGIIVRKTRQSITQTAMVTYEQKVLPEGWLGNLIHFRTQEQEYRYPNGSILAVGGIDKPSKIMSSEWDFIYVMEATELSDDDLESLTTRLRNGVMPYQQLGLDCNPGPPTHWLKQRCDRGVTLMLESRHEDNPSVTPEYLATLDALTGVRYLRLRKGIWAAAEGLVYEEWNPAIHKVTRAQLTARGVLAEDGTLNRSVVKRVLAASDFGWTNPGTLQVYALDGDGRVYLVYEVYQTQRTIDWWIGKARNIHERFGFECLICDPAEPSYIEQYRKSRINAVAAINDIAPGIDALKSRLRVAGDGRPRFFVYEHALAERDDTRVEAHQPYCFEQEILEYVWPKSKDGQPVKEVPVKINDHAMDTARYFCRYLADPTPTASDHLAALQKRVALQQQRRAS